MTYSRIGRRIGPYHVEALLGAGGMAEVYRARQTSTDRLVAIKVLAADVSARAQFTELFRREARTIAQLQHTHILPVFDFGEDEGSPYLVMPLMQNGTIATRVRGRRVPIEQVVRVGTQVGDALAYAHERGVVHCDVKPGNILLDDRGNCLLADFGIARLIGAGAYDDDPLGTPAYMAPEQAAGKHVDGRADIFALGAVLYELAAGARPMRKDDAYAQVHGAPQPPSSINSAVPQQLDWILLRALAQKREDRFADAGEMVRALHALRPTPTPTPATKPATSTKPTTPATPATKTNITPTPMPGTPAADARKKQKRATRINFASLTTIAVAGALLLIALAVGLTFMPQPSFKSTSESTSASIVPATPSPEPTPAPIPPCGGPCGWVAPPLGTTDFAHCSIALNNDFAIGPDHENIGCPSQAVALNRAAAIIEYENGSVLYFAQPGAKDALRGVAYVLFNDGAAQRIPIGGKLPTDRLGKLISDAPRLTSADFQSFDRGRVFIMRGYRDDLSISVVLMDGVRGDWLAPSAIWECNDDTPNATTDPHAATATRRPSSQAGPGTTGCAQR